MRRESLHEQRLPDFLSPPGSATAAEPRPTGHAAGLPLPLLPLLTLLPLLPRHSRGPLDRPLAVLNRAAVH